MSKRLTALEVAAGVIADCRDELQRETLLSNRILDANRELLAKLEVRIREKLGQPRRRKEAPQRNPKRGDGHDADRAQARHEEARGIGP